MKIKEIEIEKIKPNPRQPRETFDREKIEELAKSIKQVGLLQPIAVKPLNENFQLIHGERRVRAMKIAGFKKITSIVKNVDEKEQLRQSVIENLQREDLTSIERENAIYSLWKIGKYKTQQKLADDLSMGQEYISHILNAKDFRDERICAAHIPTEKISTRTIIDTEGLPDGERISIIKKVAKKQIYAEQVRNIVRQKKIERELKKKSFFIEGKEYKLEKFTIEVNKRILELSNWFFLTTKISAEKYLTTDQLTRIKDTILGLDERLHILLENIESELVVR